MGLGNGNPNSGNKGSNFSYELKVLQGLQCTCDQLKNIDANTDTVEPLLAQILTAIQNGTDYEAMLVIDNVGVTWLEVRIWNGTTFDPPVYFLAGSNTTGTPVAPITYINPNTYLAQIVSYSSNLVSIEAGTPNALGQTTMAASMPVVIASNQVGVQRTPTFLRPAGTSGTIPAGGYSMSFANVGTINATVGGITLKPGETMNFDAGAINNTLGSVAYNATGAGGELLIISLV